jgi:hypothetical protein
MRVAHVDAVHSPPLDIPDHRIAGQPVLDARVARRRPGFSGGSGTGGHGHGARLVPNWAPLCAPGRTAPRAAGWWTRSAPSRRHPLRP